MGDPVPSAPVHASSTLTRPAPLPARLRTSASHGRRRPGGSVVRRRTVNSRVMVADSPRRRPSGSGHERCPDQGQHRLPEGAGPSCLRHGNRTPSSTTAYCHVRAFHGDECLLAVDGFAHVVAGCPGPCSRYRMSALGPGGGISVVWRDRARAVGGSRTSGGSGLGCVGRLRPVLPRVPQVPGQG